MTAVIALGAILAWAVSSRYLFRRWVRNNTFWINADRTCTHGYRHLHKGESCHDLGEPASHNLVAVLALAAGLVLPATLLVLFVMASPPQGRREREERTRALEEENARLRRKQENAPEYLPGQEPAPCPCEGTLCKKGHYFPGALCPCKGTLQGHIRSPHYVLGCEPR